MSGNNVLTFKDLRDKKGLNYTRQHVARMVKEGRFPKPFKLERGAVNYWRESAIDAFINQLADAAQQNEGQ